MPAATPRHAPRNLPYWIAAVLALLLCGAAGLVIWKFPFSRDAFIEQIRSATGGQVEVGGFRKTWFPPGFSVERVRVSDPAGDSLTIDSLSIEGSYAGFLRKPARLAKIHASGLRLLIPDQKVDGNPRTLLHPSEGGSNPAFSVAEIRLENAALDFASGAPGNPPLEFALHTLKLSNVGLHERIGYEVSMHNPKPSGEIRSKGEFGPFDTRNPGSTPVAGAFYFDHADLTVPNAISGILGASGNFRGRVSRLDCSGTADVPAFQVHGSSHPVHIAARFNAAVNALNGNTELKQILAHYNRTTVAASGTVASTPGRAGKTLTLNTAVDHGRVEDMLLLFTNKPSAAMEGPIDVRAKFTVPPGPPGFLTKLAIDGDFSITHSHFSNPNTQTPIDRLSASAEGESKREQREAPTLADADVRGHVTDRNGVARLPSVVFEVPGVRGKLAGTFALREKTIAMSGVLETTGKLSDTTSGIKTLLVKAIGPLWRKKASTKIIPFEITGKASHPVFRLKLRG